MAEIRLRDVDPKLLRELELIQKDLHQKTATATIEQLINSYRSTQSHIKELSQRNSHLHKRIAYYVNINSVIEKELIAAGKAFGEAKMKSMKSFIESDNRVKKSLKLIGTKKNR
jgi:cell division septum initiation protein DivIVA